jgi:hypothetical protein
MLGEGAKPFASSGDGSSADLDGSFEGLGLFE